MTLADYKPGRLPNGNYSNNNFGTVWAVQTRQGAVSFLAVDGVLVARSAIELPPGPHKLETVYREVRGTALSQWDTMLNIEVKSGQNYVVGITRDNNKVIFHVEEMPPGTHCEHVEDFRQGFFLGAKVQCR